MTILYFYITIFTIYFLALTCASLKKNRRVRDKYSNNKNNLCVVVYATGVANNLPNIIKQLKEQDYAKEHYKIFAILDKCEKSNDIEVKSDLDVNYITINNLEPIGKSQAYSILAEKLAEANNINAYVFLNANNNIDVDFLTGVNYYLKKHDVFIPMINYIPLVNNFTFLQSIKATFSRYCYKFIYQSRTNLGLTNIINTDSFVIKKDVLDKIEIFEFQDIIAEIKYTIKLALENIKVSFIDDLKVYTDISNFDSRKPSLSRKLGIFWNMITHSPNYLTFELVASLIQPNWLLLILVYILLLNQFSFWVSYTTILITFILFIIAFCISVMNTKLYAKEYLYLLLYPIYSVGHIFKNLPPIRWIRKITNLKTYKHNIEKMTTNVIVTDGNRDFQCQIELISDNGLAKVKFINNNKTYITKNNHLRMVDAIRELSDKLNDYGLSLKICQCCKFFEPAIDGSTNMIKGCCNCQFKGRVEGDIIPTLAWNTCPNFNEQNIVSLF